MRATSPLEPLALTLALLSAACAPDHNPLESIGGPGTTSGSSTIGTVTSVELTTEPTTQASDTEVSPEVSCECAVPDQLWLASYDADKCGRGPCGSIEFTSTAGEQVLDVVALDCALDMLIAGTPGVVHETHYIDGGFEGGGGFVRIGADRRGLSRTWAWLDLGCVVNPLQMVQLKPPEYFSDCKAMADAYDRYYCLQAWTAEPLGERCAEEYDCSDA